MAEERLTYCAYSQDLRTSSFVNKVLDAVQAADNSSVGPEQFCRLGTCQLSRQMGTGVEWYTQPDRKVDSFKGSGGALCG